MSNYLIHGGYYSRNYGDFILIDKTIQAIKLADSSARIGLAMAPKNVREEFTKLNKLSIWDLRKIDKVIFSGGGYLGERDYKVLIWSLLCIYRQILLPLICIVMSKPYAYFAVEVGPIRYKFLRYLIGKILDSSEFVIVRNKASYDFCKKIMKKRSLLSMETDFAQNEMYLKGLSKKHINDPSLAALRDNKTIGIHVTKYSDDYFHIVGKLKEKLKVLKGEGFKFIFFTDSPAHDGLIEDASFIFKDMYNNEEMLFLPYRGPEYTTSVITLLDAVITSKLHVGIIGLTTGAIPLSLPSHNKTVRYYEQINYPELCLYKCNSEADAEKSINMFSQLVMNHSRIDLPENTVISEKKVNEMLQDFISQ